MRLIYEIALRASERQALDACLAQERGHLAAHASVAAVYVLEPSQQDATRADACLRVELADAAAFEDFAQEEALALLTRLRDRLGDTAIVRAEVLDCIGAPTELREAARSPEREALRCRNCGSVLRGQYCWACGQRARNRMVSVWQLLRELVGDLFELDSRLWRSLIPLVARPGKLTAEYLAGRRVHYTPPLRMYLVISVVFFVLLSLPELAGRVSVDAPAESSQAAGAVGEGQCEQIELEGLSIPGLSRERAEAIAKRSCQRLSQRGEGAFVKALLDNLAGSMFVFLPLLALAMKLLYPLTGRYYVEHLLFLVHYHAFVFVLLSLAMVYQWSGHWLEPLAAGRAWVVAGVSAYIPVYLLAAMRRVYGQSWLATIYKFFLLSLAYAIGAAVMIGVLALVTALTI